MVAERLPWARREERTGSRDRGREGSQAVASPGVVAGSGYAASKRFAVRAMNHTIVPAIERSPPSIR